MTDTDPPAPSSTPPTRLDSEAPRTSLDGSSAAPPPTSLDGAAPPTTLDGAGQGHTYVNLPGPLLEDYEALSDMASGGEGDLLLARHRPTGEKRVVKIYRGDRRRDERALEILSAADPAHVVTIHESGQHGGRWWEVMEYCEHGSLVELISREGPRLPVERIEEIVAEVAAALTHLHELKIPHRDLKPANIMVRSLEPELDLVLADFGLARVLDLSKEMHSRLIISAAYASPQASSSGAISPAMDWWSLGVIVAELAQGRNPFQQENGEWLSDRVIIDWISSRPIDLSGIEDERIANLCRGLTLRDDRRAHRWGAEKVSAWLSGENPEVATEVEAYASPRAAASPFPFTDPQSGRTRPFIDPTELARALAHEWDEACELLSGAASHRAEQRALRNFLRSLELTEAEQILAEQDDVEERLVRLLIELDPAIAPTFRGYSIDRDGLLALAHSEGESPTSALAAIFSERVLLDYSRSAGHSDLAELDAAWHEELVTFEQTIDTARSNEGEAILADQRERAAATETARRQILTALLDADSHRQVLERAAEASADESAKRQGWFAAIADEAADG
jgi:eukaryotic-like serine/threonine-protein kinase